MSSASNLVNDPYIQSSYLMLNSLTMLCKNPVESQKAYIHLNHDQYELKQLEHTHKSR